MGASESTPVEDNEAVERRRQRRVLDKRTNEQRNFDRCVVDTAALLCPVCYEMFISTPLLLDCGHTVCTSCIGRMLKDAERNRHTLAAGTGSVRTVIDGNGCRYFVIDCPLCRTTTTSLRDHSRLPVNYALETLVDSIAESVGADDSLPDPAAYDDATLRHSHARLLGVRRELARQVDEQKTTIAQLEKQVRLSHVWKVLGQFLLFWMTASSVYNYYCDRQ